MKKISFAVIILYSLSTNAQDTIRIKLRGNNTFASSFWSFADNNIYNNTSGSVGIGTSDTKGYKFAVNGDAIFNKIKVKSYANWPDYVFQQGYPLLSLQEIESYIKLNNHLPGVPSASEVKMNGVDLVENQAILLKKIEELTLLLIDQDKRLDEQAKKIVELEKAQKNKNN
ncbi:MAG: hypothetical protein ACTHK0_18150 [Ginsengibacter sp.]